MVYFLGFKQQERKVNVSFSAAKNEDSTLLADHLITQCFGIASNSLTTILFTSTFWRYSLIKFDLWCKYWDLRG